MGAVLGKRVALSVVEALNIKKELITFWTDSTSVLWWVKGHSRHIKPFVANRIGELQAATNDGDTFLPRRIQLIIWHEVLHSWS